MAKLLFIDFDSDIPSNIHSYTHVICLNERISIKIDRDKLININSCEFFTITHRTARDINKLLLSKYDIPEALHLSLMKMSDRSVYESARVIEILKRYYSEYDEVMLISNNSKLIKFFIDFLHLGLRNVTLYKTEEKHFNFRKTKTVLKVLLYIFNYIRVKTYKHRNIFAMFNDKISYDFVKPYLSDVLVYPIFTRKNNLTPDGYNCPAYIKYKFITPRALIDAMREYIKNKLIVKKLVDSSEIRELYFKCLLNLEIESGVFLSLREKVPNLKRVIGLFDTYASIDYVTYRLNSKQSVETICVPHGVNFKQKATYISYGTNVYSLWSENHLKRMEESNLVDEKISVQKIITGNVVYTETLGRKIKEKERNNKILIVGEYFSKDNYYSSPFNKSAATKLFNIISEFIAEHKMCEVTIRTRLDDEYAKLASSYINENIKLSSPTNSISDEINQHDLIISVFSNALHEALLLEKHVLQVNLLGVENYRDLAADGLVYYADTERKLIEMLNKWIKGDLYSINYNKHLKEYANNGCFTKLKLG